MTVLAPSVRRRTLAFSLPLLAALAGLSGCGGDDSGSQPSTTTVDISSTTPVSDLDTGYQLRIVNAGTGATLTIAGSSQVAGAAVSSAVDDASLAQRWHVMPMGSGQYNIENMLTHQVVGITSASTETGAQAVQWADNGTSDHLWAFYQLSNGNYALKNVNSGLYLEDAGSGVIDQIARDTSAKAQEWTITVTTTAAYPAPMAVSGAGIDVHDPSMIQDPQGTYWLYGTHNTLAQSSDLTNFTAMTTGAISPDFSWWASKNTTGTGGRTDIWAPSVLYANGTYYQYYSIPVYDTPSQVGTNQGAEAVIALATSPNPDGPWTDAGEIIASCGTTPGCTTTFNAIDPAPYIDSEGKWWMAFGSWEDGIHVLQLDPATGLQLASDQTVYHIARRDAGEEGPFIFPYTVGGVHYYYYFAPINVCCQGTSSLYRIIVGRSTSPTGPFLDRGGLDLLNGGGTILLSTHGTIYGPGGQSVMDSASGPILVYHYYDGTQNGLPQLGLNTLVFDAQGWPHVE
ncbi:family 43 glycosylhydrolase [Novosphingobium sp. 1949]|uniref:Family 43 glycosylhydrolase n=1 Tax=Novosphingobium organovorum TaxID=2930092 RepID=A0ABT0BDN6_9SPHN|nr:family 43 glycosylhydrolase [Novosphingobium organovorum]MCJ2183098.1 family 43 glycosylhydrolase [Novosphingobium organovorum]